MLNRLEKVAAIHGVSPEPYQKMLHLCDQYVSSFDPKTGKCDATIGKAMEKATAEAKQIYGEAVFNQIALDLISSPV